MKPPVQFPAGVYPDIHSVGGETFLPYAKVGTGLVMHRFPDGAPNPNAAPEWTDSQVGKGHARLTAFTGLILLAYEQQRNGAITRVVHAQSGQPATNWEIESDGGQSCWGPGGLFTLQDRSQRVLVGPWPDKPRADSPLSRQGNAGGVSRFDGDHVVLVTDETLGYPDWSDDGSAVVSQAQHGGIAMAIGDVSGVLLPGRNTLAPRVTRQTNGKYSACFYDVDSHGATGVYVVTDIEPADLTAAPAPEIRVAPYTSPKAIGVIFGSSDQYGYHPSKGNCEVLFDDFDRMVTKRPVIVSGGARNVPAAMRLGSWSDRAESDRTAPEPVFRYWDGRHYEDRIVRRGRRLFQAYPRKNESPADFLRSMTEQLDRFPGEIKGLVVKAYPGNPPEVFSETDLLPYFPVYDTLVRRDDVDTMLWFDEARSGLKFFPKWRRWYDAFVDASPGLPSYTIVEPPAPPPTPVPPTPIPPSPGPAPGPEEPEVMPLPKIVSLRRKQGFVNIDPANGKTRENAAAVGAHETFEPQENIGAEKRVAFKHLASSKLFSVDSNGALSSKTALGPDEQADVARGRYALFYNEFQGLAQVAAAFVICDEHGVPLPLR